MPPLSRTIACLAAALLGLVAGACQDDLAERIDSTCSDYCERSVECNPDSFTLDTCKDYCSSIVEECPQDRRDAALDHYQSCVELTCDELFDCSFAAEDEC